MRRRARQPQQPCRRLRPLPLLRPETPRRRSPPSAARARTPARRGTRVSSKTAKTSVRSSFARTRSVCEQRDSTFSPACLRQVQAVFKRLVLDASSPVFAWICKWRNLKYVSNGSFFLCTVGASGPLAWLCWGATGHTPTSTRGTLHASLARSCRKHRARLYP